MPLRAWFGPSSNGSTSNANYMGPPDALEVIVPWVRDRLAAAAGRTLS